MVKAYFKEVILSIKTYENISKLNFIMREKRGRWGGGSIRQID